MLLPWQVSWGPQVVVWRTAVLLQLRLVQVSGEFTVVPTPYQTPEKLNIFNIYFVGLNLSKFMLYFSSITNFILRIKDLLTFISAGTEV